MGQRKILYVPMLVLAFFLCSISSVSAQLMHLDPLPWTAPPDSTSRQVLEIQVDRFQDGVTGWSANRLLLAVILPAGDNGTYFVRTSHVTFDYGELSLFDRWPDVQGDGADPSWPGETRTSSFGQPEIGAVGNVTLSYLGASQYGLALGLPLGSDRTYPVASTSLPLRMELRKRIPFSEKNDIGITAGYLMHMGSGKGILDENAFPSGFHGAVQVTKRWQGKKKFIFHYNFENRDGRKSQSVGVEAWMPWTDVGRFGLAAARQVEFSSNRFSKWHFSVMWRFDSAAHMPGVVSESEAESRSSLPGSANRK